MTLSFLVYFQSLSTFHSLPKIPDIHIKSFLLLYHSVVLFRHHFFRTGVLFAPSPYLLSHTSLCYFLWYTFFNTQTSPPHTFIRVPVKPGQGPSAAAEICLHFFAPEKRIVSACNAPFHHKGGGPCHKRCCKRSPCHSCVAASGRRCKNVDPWCDQIRFWIRQVFSAPA